jgi:hypothetical protein
MSLLSISNSFWALASVAQLCFLVLATKRKLYIELPWFYAYTVFEVFRTVVQIALTPISYNAAANFYWATDVVDALVIIAVIRELYDKTFAGYESLRGLSQTVFLWSLGVLSVFCAFSGYLAPGNARGRLMSTLTVMERSVGVLIGGLLLALLLLALWTGISWRNRSVGMALGFVVYSAVLATAASVRATGFSRADHLIYAIFNSAGYAVGVGIWIVYAVRRTVEVRMESNESETALLRRWNTSMEAVIQTK